MTVLLTGATGLLGANLARLLSDEGVRPRLLVRSRSDRRGLNGIGYDEVLGDILDVNSLRKAMEGVAEVYHLAGSVRFDPFSASGTRRVHVDGTRNVLLAARAAGVGRRGHRLRPALLARQRGQPVQLRGVQSVPGDQA